MDERLGAYIARGAAQGLPVCSRVAGLSADENWLRDPQAQNIEELAFYREVFPFALTELYRFASDAPTVAEGAAYLPELIAPLNLPDNRYLSITPTRAFQIDRYAKREWVSGVLAGCSDKDRAFRNWMERDALFADEVRRQCAVYGYFSLVTDFGSSPAGTLSLVKGRFDL